VRSRCRANGGTLCRAAFLRRTGERERGDIHENTARRQFAADTRNKALNEAVQIRSGLSYIWDSEMKPLLRAINLLEIGAGTTDGRNIIISDEILR
jgi:isovaleryl-CoA dehydrogenase